MGGIEARHFHGRPRQAGKLPLRLLLQERGGFLVLLVLDELLDQFQPRVEGDRLIVRSGGFNDDRPKAFEKGGEGCWTDVLVFTRPVEAPKADAVTSNP